MNKQMLAFTKGDYVLKISGVDGVKEIATATAKEEGDKIVATFEGEIDGSHIAYLVKGEFDKGAISFILEPGEIHIADERMEKYYITSAKGTPLNQKYHEYSEEIQKANAPFVAKMEALNSNKALTQVERGQQRATLMKEQANAQIPVKERFFQENKDNALSALLYIQDYQIKNNDLDLAERLWNLLSRKNRMIKEVADRHAHAVAFNTLKVGDMFRDFTLVKGTVDGKDVKLSDYVGKGKYVLVDFWASWCMACRYAIPDVKVAYEKCKGDNFDCISIATWDKRPKALKAIEEEAMPWLQLIDEEGLSSRTYGISAIPRIILFSPEGKILKLDIKKKDIVETVTRIVKNGATE